MEKRTTIGILAHVDAGKTTLAEAMLYRCGAIRKAGRVDHGDAHMDTHSLERARGITIFASQAQLQLGDWKAALLDTPGHVDFSAEMERTLWVLDYAILVINGADGVQAHVRTLWKLLRQYRIPVFLFVNKMDQPGTDRAALLAELKDALDGRCVDFTADRARTDIWEDVAVCDEALLEKFLEEGTLSAESIAHQIKKRQLYPCYFGSALKDEGVQEFLDDMARYMEQPMYPAEFGARVYKIGRDEQGNRLSYLKVTGGSLKVKQLIRGETDGESWEEKADQIRLYSGGSFEAVQEAPAGTVCAVTGLSRTWAGEGMGMEGRGPVPALEPVLTYQLLPPDGCNLQELLQKLRRLEEELPELHVVWQEELSEIHVRVMGEVQIEILKSLIQERFGVPVEFGAGSIVYKETIENVVEGVGHFEPLRHYAEVHLLLEPGERGSGLVFESRCSEDVLDRNWQRLILTHLAERSHPGVLTGSEITDMKISLVAGRAHAKHTEGGDFRQATYRAVRQGLKQAKSVLLEPFYEFRLTIPADKLGRAMTDIQKMTGTFSEPENENGQMVLKGSAPVSQMQGYAAEVTAYTRGLGHLSCALKGYGPCANADEVIAAMGYDSEADILNPTGSVFCAHGAGFYVPWNQVFSYMQVDGVLRPKKEPKEAGLETARRSQSSLGAVDPKELDAIFERTYGPIRRDRQGVGRVERSFRKEPEDTGKREIKLRKKEKEYLLVDGYNIIFAWEDLKALSEINMEAARGKLMDILSNLQGALGCTLILVFDAYRVEGGTREIFKYHNIHVVYTKEAETADQYIEKTVHELGRKYQVTVATSDGLEQVIIMGQGASRLSASGLRELVEVTGSELRETMEQKPAGGKNYLFENLSDEVRGWIEEILSAEE
ncbi:translation factor GTPase family protein [Laedolimicola ammoniilytica]|uniref:TetM/TetW/TetO/TetS family tetracycline resistance ribosomal protection protein n=1 Tax=Laedolimicola ammoniilytica TaxID=2981771 RepID=A0ABT2RUL6_9FIRM|nr:TetM/TetW/TetO/TetS family tetracycline resistance ribosomal protection protein [Laedolimicola ammoniilytica]MCU6696005.1 TetM/TetW/TetO/TetS family tetracycline resistance ribosomal protection protein [Laedolimicola ammoniilytica]SCH40167.1 Tetracycline resistance protein tetM [uncultured Clostridium sp.]